MSFIQKVELSGEGRAMVREKYDYHCGYCGVESDPRHLIVEPIDPAKNDSITLDDFIPACISCHHLRMRDNLQHFRKRVGEMHELLMTADSRFKIMRRLGIIEVKQWDGSFYFERVAEEHKKRIERS